MIATAAAVTPVGTSIIATMKPALKMLLALLPETSREAPTETRAAAGAAAGDPIPVEVLLHTLSGAMPDNGRAGRGSAVASACDANIHGTSAARTVSTLMTSAVSALACPAAVGYRASASPASAV